MKHLIQQLRYEASKIESEQKSFDFGDNQPTHGTMDQTRVILIQGMFEQAKANIAAGIAQLEILNRHLY